MGKKQTRKREQFLFHSTCFLIFFIILTGCGCFYPKSMGCLEKNKFRKAEILKKKGNYVEAVQEYNNIMRSHYNNITRAKACFYAGLLWIDPDNPEKNHVNALKYFRFVTKDYPESDFNDESKIFICLITDLFEKDKNISSLEEKIKKLKQQVEKSRQTIISLTKTEKILKQKQKKLEDTQRKLKEIDIGIEKKKRESLLK